MIETDHTKYVHSPETIKKMSESQKAIYLQKRALGIFPEATLKSIRRREWARRNPNKVRDYNRNWALNNPDRVRSRGYKTRYGITLDDYNRILNEQENKCSICGKHESEIKKRLCVDHSHVTNKVRGLLCGPCNRFLGMFENETWMSKASDYLNRYKE